MFGAGPELGAFQQTVGGIAEQLSRDFYVLPILFSFIVNIPQKRYFNSYSALLKVLQQSFRLTY